MNALLAHLHLESFTLFDWVLTALAAVSAGWSIWLAVRYTLKPGETDPSHPKFLIFDDRRPADPTPRKGT